MFPIDMSVLMSGQSPFFIVILDISLASALEISSALAPSKEKPEQN